MKWSWSYEEGEPRNSDGERKEEERVKDQEERIEDFKLNHKVFFNTFSLKIFSLQAMNGRTEMGQPREREATKF